jgi:anti-anti-sigma factor
MESKAIDDSTAISFLSLRADRLCVKLNPPLDQYGAEVLKTSALSVLEAEGDVILDFKEIDRMHAACLQVLLALRNDLEPKGRKVILQSVEPGVRTLFRVAGAEDFFQFAEAAN